MQASQKARVGQVVPQTISGEHDEVALVQLERARLRRFGLEVFKNK